MSPHISWRNDRKQYGGVSRLLHWLMAVLILIMLGLGWSSDFIPKEWTLVVLGIHKSLGIVILTLAIVRLTWRFYNSPPPLPKFMPRWEKIAAVTVHYLLYGFLLAMPITGWAMTSAKGKPVIFLGIVQLPDLVAQNQGLGKLLEEIHGDLAYLLVAAIILHVIAALYHNFIRKDKMLIRMWPVSQKNK